MSPASIALRVAGPVVRCFPGLARYASVFAARVAWRLRKQTRRMVIRNLLPACGGDRKQARAVAPRVFESVATYYLEVMSLPDLDTAKFETERLEVVNPEHLAVFDTDEPVIVVSAHMGNPELAVQGLLGRRRPFVAIVEPLADRSFAKRFLSLRRSAGGDFVEASPAGLLRAVRALRQGAVVALLGDRDIQGNGVCVSLLGRNVRLARGPWEMARRENCTVLPGFCARIPHHRQRVTFESPFTVDKTDDPEGDIVNAAQRWAKLFESHLRADPGQWVVLEDFWTNHACRDRHPNAF